MSVAKTILNQIKVIDPMATWAWGVKNLVAGNESTLDLEGTLVKSYGYLQFKTSGMVTGHKGWVIISLNGLDTYDIITYKIRKCLITKSKIVNDIYCDQLVPILNDIIK